MCVVFQNYPETLIFQILDPVETYVNMNCEVSLRLPTNPSSRIYFLPLLTHTQSPSLSRSIYLFRFLSFSIVFNVNLLL